MIRRTLLVALLFVAGSVAAQTSPNLEQGLKPYGSYQGGNIDSVNLSTGNLMLHVPLVSYPQRGDLQMAFFIRYNDKNWAFRTVSTGPSGPVQAWYWAGGGVSIGRAQSYWLNNIIDRITNVATGDTTTMHVCSITSADGSSHQLDSDSGTHVLCGNRALDASGIVNGIDVGGVHFPTSGAYPLFVTDRNGNQITLNSTGWTDTLGRSIPGTTTPSDSQMAGQAPPTSPRIYGEGLYPGVPTTDLSNCPGTPVAARLWNLPGFGNSATPSSATSLIKLCYSNFTYQTQFHFGSVGDVSGTATLLSAIVLPDLSSWQFNYDSYLSLNLVRFPTGGSISYQYQTLVFGGSGSRAVIARIVDASDGTGGHEWDYAYNSPASGQTLVTAPPDAGGVRNETVHVFTNNYETETRWYSGNHTSGPLLKTVDTAYPTPFVENPYDEYSSDGTSSYINVVPLSTTTTWPNGKVAKVTRQYDTGTTWTFFDANSETESPYQVIYGKVINGADYDYGQGAAGALVRQTVTNYLWQANSSYLAANLVNLPQSVTAEDSAGNRCSETDYTYDEPSYLTGSGYGSANQLGAPPGGVRGNASTVAHWLAAMNPNTTSCSPSSGWSSFAGHTNWYDTGEPYQSIDPLNHTTTYAYSGSFSGAYVTQTTMPSTSSPNPASHIISGNYDFNTGLLTSFTDQNGQTSNYTYDNMFRVATAKMPLDAATGLNPETDFFYPSVTQVERKQKIDGSRWTDTFVQFDGLGRESRRATFNDQAGNDWDQLDTCYDNLGRVDYVSYPYQNTGFVFSNPCTALVEPGDKTAYDPLGRVKTVTHSDNSSVTTNYTGAATQVIDEGNGS